jgi:hypothetical protein
MGVKPKTPEPIQEVAKAIALKKYDSREETGNRKNSLTPRRKSV